MSHDGMKLLDFEIDGFFYTATGKWRVVDVGTWTIIAYKEEEGEDENEGAYDVNDIIFYDYEFGGCSLKPFEEGE